MIITKKNIYFILLILFIIPSGLMSFGLFSILKPFVQYGRYLAMLCITCDILLHFKYTIKEYKFSLLAGVFGTSFIVYLLNTPTIRDMGHIKFYISIIFNFLCVAYITEYYIKRHMKYFIKIMYKYYAVLLYSNFFCMLIKPNGFYMSGENMIYLIAQDNGLILYIICGILFTLLYDLMWKKKYNFELILMLVVALMTAIISQSATALVTCVAFLTMVVVIKLCGKNKIVLTILNFRNISICYLIITYLVLFKDIIMLFADFIVNVLHRDPTLTSRTSLWKRAILLISQSPIFGWGYPRDVSEFAIVTELGTRFTSHNNILEILLRGGIVSFLVIVLLIAFVCRKTKKYAKNEIVLITVAAYIALLIFYFSEVSFSEAGWTMILALLANSSYLIKYNNEVEKTKK